MDLKIKKIKNEEVVEIRGFFGKNFPNVIERFLGERMITALFIEIYPDKVVYLRWFSLEVHEVFMAVLDDPTVSPINKKFLYQVILQLRQDDYVKYLEHTGMSEEAIRYAKSNSKHMLDMSKIKKAMNFGVLPHQEGIFEDYAFMRYVRHTRGWVVSAEPGTGKTFVSLALSVILDPNIVIIVAPRGTLDTVWVDSLTRSGMFKKPQSYWSTLEKRPYDGEKYIIIHYEFISKLISTIGVNGLNAMVIIDESQNINEKGTKRDIALTELMDKLDPSNVILLSGTPIKGKTLEVSNLLKLTDKRFTKRIEARFEKLYKSPGQRFLEILTARYKSISTYVSKSEMKTDDSTTISMVVTIDNPEYFTIKSIKKRMRKYAEDHLKEYENKMEEYRAKYDKIIEKAFKQGLNDGVIDKYNIDHYKNNIEIIIDRYHNGGLSEINKVVREANAFEKNFIEPYTGGDLKLFRDLTSIIKYVGLKVQGEILARVVMRTRIDLAKAYARHLDYKTILNMTVKKTLTFSNYGEVCEEAYAALKKYTDPLRIYWEWTENIYETVEKFSKYDKHQALIVTYKSVSAGIPILAANLTVFFDLPFKSYVYEQAIARTDRNGQTEPCTYVQLLLDTGTEPNISSRNVDIIQMSKDMVQEITTVKNDVEYRSLEIDEGDDFKRFLSIEESYRKDAEIITECDEIKHEQKSSILNW